jgi:hypothetical protein
MGKAAPLLTCRCGPFALSYRQISMSLIPAAMPMTYFRRVQSRESGGPMKNASDTSRSPRVLVDIVDLLIGACALFVAYTIFSAAADYLDLLIAGVIALVGIGVMLEPSVAGNPTKTAIGSGRSGRLARG